MWKIKDSKKEEEENDLSEVFPGMKVEVMTMENRLIFMGLIEEVGNSSVRVSELEGGNVPYIEYNTRIKLRGHTDSMPIYLYGMIGGSTKRFWRIDRLGSMQTQERRSYFRQTVSNLTFKATPYVDPHSTDAEAQPDSEEAPTYKCQMADISAGGTLFSSSGKFHQGDLLSLREIQFIDGDAFYSFNCVVRRIIDRDGIPYYGCEFIDLGEREQDRLIRTILALQRKELQARRGHGDY